MAETGLASFIDLLPQLLVDRQKLLVCLGELLDLLILLVIVFVVLEEVLHRFIELLVNLLSLVLTIHRPLVVHNLLFAEYLLLEQLLLLALRSDLLVEIVCLIDLLGDLDEARF